MLALLKKIPRMFNIVLMNDFASYLTTFTLVLLVSTLCYFWYIYKPYAKLPACRLEYQIPYWILKRIPLNYAVMQMLIEQSKRYESEGVFAVWLGIPTLIVYGEEIVKLFCVIIEVMLLMTIVNSAADKPKSYKLWEFAIGKGILTSNGEEWKKQRKISAPAFHVTALKTYTTTMNNHSEEMIERLSRLDGQPIDDIIDIVSLCGIGILAETNTGERKKNLEEYAQVVKVLNKTTDFMVKRLWSPWLYFDFALQLFPSAREANKLIKNVVKDSLKPRLENIKESLISRQASPLASASDHGLMGKRIKPIGESFVEQHLQDPTITMDEVASQISFIVAAAFDTVIHSLKFALFLLGQHQDVQDRAFQEVLSETEGHVTYDDLQRLTYLECVIKETLRLYPVPLFGRHLNEDLQCGEYKLPKNSTIWVFPYMLHRNPEIYPDPEKFDPERFMDKNSRIKPWNFIPFAEGLRPCIGKNYAMVQMKIILAHVLRNFTIISLDRIEDVDLSWSVVLECTKKLRMQFLPRESTQSRSSGRSRLSFSLLGKT